MDTRGVRVVEPSGPNQVIQDYNETKIRLKNGCHVIHTILLLLQHVLLRVLEKMCQPL